MSSTAASRRTAGGLSSLAKNSRTGIRRARKSARPALRLPGTVALPESHGRGKRSGRSSRDPRVRLAAQGGAAHSRQARRDLSRPRREAERPRAGLDHRSQADGRDRARLLGLQCAGAPRHSGRADLIARRAYGRAAAGPCAPLGRLRGQLRADLAHPGRGAVDLRPHHRDARRQGGDSEARASFDRAKLVGAMGGFESQAAPRAQAAAAAGRAARPRLSFGVRAAEASRRAATSSRARARSSGLPVSLAMARPIFCLRLLPRRARARAGDRVGAARCAGCRGPAIGRRLSRNGRLRRTSACAR